MIDSIVTSIATLVLLAAVQRVATVRRVEMAKLARLDCTTERPQVWLNTAKLAAASAGDEVARRDVNRALAEILDAINHGPAAAATGTLVRRLHLVPRAEEGQTPKLVAV